MCSEFTPGCEHWPRPDWCATPTNTRPRYMFDEKGSEWAELVQFFGSAEFRLPFEQHLGIDLEYSTATMWADMTGFGALGHSARRHNSFYLANLVLSKIRFCQQLEICF